MNMLKKQRKQLAPHSSLFTFHQFAYTVFPLPFDRGHRNAQWRDNGRSSDLQPERERLPKELFKVTK
jgi:hypothetical protein